MNETNERTTDRGIAITPIDISDSDTARNVKNAKRWNSTRLISSHNYMNSTIIELKDEWMKMWGKKYT